MAINAAAGFTSPVNDVEAYIADETLPLIQKQLVAYQFGDPLTLPKGRGTTYTATRFNRVPLPYQPITEGSPPPGETMTIAQVSAQAQQWGDRIIMTDVAELTIKHPLFQKAIELTALQVSETLERNTFNALNAGTQINYVGSVGSRHSLTTTSYLTGLEITRANAMLSNVGAWQFMGEDQTDPKRDVSAGGARASSNPRGMPHYVAIIHPFVEGDLYRDTTIVAALSYSDINRLYNAEIGEWQGIRFCRSNMVPYWTGFAAVTPSPQVGGGTFASNTYVVQVTGQDTQNQYESQIYAANAAITVALNGSITLTTPNVPGFTYNVYVSAAGGTTPAYLGLCALGPSYGPATGQATQLPYNTAVTITGLGLTQSPPANPNTGVTVYPTYIFGRGAFGQVQLDDVKFSYLNKADKSDSLNQLRVVGWKTFYGTLIENQNFMMRIESASAISATFG